MSAGVTAGTVRGLVERGGLGGRSYLPALSFVRHDEDWTRWALLALLGLGAGHILTGIVFFFAYSWDDLSGALKFLIVQGGILGCVGAWIGFRYDKDAQVFGIAATILVGVLFAVFGQVYQTPAMIHTPFTLWAILTLPFALASRSRAHWLVWIIIAAIAALSYINTAIRHVHGDTLANWAHLVLGIIMLGIYVAHRLRFDRGPNYGHIWFDVSIVAVGLCLVVAAFTEGFWSDGNLLIWTTSSLTLLGLLLWLYHMRPNIAALCLTSFAIAVLASNGFFKLIDFSDGVGIMFVSFLWFAGLTIGLALAFKHFIARFKTPATSIETSDADDTERQRAASVSLSDFAQEFSITEETIDKLDSGDETPWYVDMLLAFGGIITAIFAAAFFGTLLAVTLDIENEWVFLITGLIVYGGSMFARNRFPATFTQHLFNTLLMGGGALTLAGIGMIFESIIAVSMGGMLLSVITAALLKDRIIEFLMGVGFVIFLLIGLFDLDMPYIPAIAGFVCIALGAFFISRPVRGRIYYVGAAALLMSIPILGLFIGTVGIDRFIGYSSGRVEQGVILAASVGAIAYLNLYPKEFERPVRPPLTVIIPLLIVAAIMPLGSVAALLVILTGYILGYRTLAVIGVLLQIGFVARFYYDLEISLLSKSVIMMVSGCIFAGLWLFVSRQREAAA